MSLLRAVVDIIKRHFLSGVLVVVPIILTYWVLSALFQAIDGILQPIIHSLIGYYLPGLGVVTTILIIILAGFFTRNILGARLYALGDRLIVRVPIIRPIYLSAKQLLNAVTNGKRESFKEVCLIEYPRKSVWVMGFVSRYTTADLGEGSKRYATLFIGSSPTPITGWTVIVPEDQIYRLNMTIEDGIKFLVSGGVVSPDVLAPFQSNDISNQGEGSG